MIKISTFVITAIFTLNADVSCFDNYEAYQKCKKAKKVIKNNRGDVPDYVLKDAVNGYLERPSEYPTNEEWLYRSSNSDEKRKGKYHD